MPSAETAIFISHVNGDPDAEPVLNALVDGTSGLKAKLTERHDAYEVAYDREIIAGQEWRRTIEAWLIDCAAAVVLVSDGAFDPQKPWVSHESTVLTIAKTWRRELCIIPVLLNGSEKHFDSQPAFNPGRLPEIQGIRYPDPPRLGSLSDLVDAVAHRLKTELPPRDSKPLTGLAKHLADALLGFSPDARSAAASSLSPGDTDPDAKVLALRFLDADPVTAQQAFYALCNKARAERLSGAKHSIARVLGALAVRAEDAKPFALEAVNRGLDKSGQALLFDCEDPDVLDLYLTRVSHRDPHEWDVNDCEGVLEFGHSDDLKKSVRRFVGANYGKTAGQKESLQFTRGKATIGGLRQAGFPVLLRRDYPEDRDPNADFEAIRDVCRDLLVLYTVSPDVEVADDHAAAFRCIAALGEDGYERVIQRYGPLLKHCENTTPEEEIDT